MLFNLAPSLVVQKPLKNKEFLYRWYKGTGGNKPYKNNGFQQIVVLVRFLGMFLEEQYVLAKSGGN